MILRLIFIVMVGRESVINRDMASRVRLVSSSLRRRWRSCACPVAAADPGSRGGGSGGTRAAAAAATRPAAAAVATAMRRVAFSRSRAAGRVRDLRRRIAATTSAFARRRSTPPSPLTPRRRTTRRARPRARRFATRWTAGRSSTIMQFGPTGAGERSIGGKDFRRQHLRAGRSVDRCGDRGGHRRAHVRSRQLRDVLLAGRRAVWAPSSTCCSTKARTPRAAPLSRRQARGRR